MSRIVGLRLPHRPTKDVPLSRIAVHLIVTSIAFLSASKSYALDCSPTGVDDATQAAKAALAPVVPDLAKGALETGLRAYFRASCLGQTTRSILSIIDYSLPSAARRLWVLDVERAALLFHERVAHGRGSGEEAATRFSDKPSSLATSLGMFLTGKPYIGKHGYSLRVDGMEPANSHARNRSIVIHPAEYMTNEFVEEHGRAGRSWGCPAVDPAVSRPLIDAIKGGTVLWSYYPNADWLKRSPYLSGR